VSDQGAIRRVVMPRGELLACPKCHSACRVGSPYHEANAGNCHRCGEVMTAGSVPKRAARFSVQEQHFDIAPLCCLDHTLTRHFSDGYEQTCKVHGTSRSTDVGWNR